MLNTKHVSTFSVALCRHISYTESMRTRSGAVSALTRPNIVVAVCTDTTGNVSHVSEALLAGGVRPGALTRVLSGMLILSLLLLTGCAHSVKYKLTAQDRWNGDHIDKVACVQNFSDHAVLLTNNEVKLEDKTWRVNPRSGYKNKDLTDGVTHMIARHLEHSGLFKRVVTGTNAAGADLDLTGEISAYTAMARVNSAAEGVTMGTAGFGAIGALIGGLSTSGMKTDVRAEVVLTNVVLVTRSSGAVLWRNSVIAQTNFTGYWRNADRAVVYAHADAMLKQAVRELIQNLAAAIAAKNTNSPPR
jgi:hypothetical protein